MGGVYSVAEMSVAMLSVLSMDWSSCLYRLFTTKSAWCYVGLVECRPALERHTEHIFDMLVDSKVTPEGDQDSLEARVVTYDDRLCSIFHDKTATDIRKGTDQYRRRLPIAADVRDEDVQKLVQGVANRAVQMTSGSDGELLYCCLIELKLEVVSCGLPMR